MARNINKLTARGLVSLTEPGLYGDGSGLYFQVSKWRTQSWLYRFSLNKRRRDMGLGPYPDVTLQAARDKAAECRALVREGVDPIENRKLTKARTIADQGKFVTFKDAAEQYIKANEAGWSNLKHSQQWRNTLATYAYPIIGTLPVNVIETTHVQKILTPIWTEKVETAKRVRGRIEAVLDAVKVQGLRDGENPARWKGHLDKILPKPSKVRTVKHHAALPYAEIGAFIVTLLERDAVAAKALEFAILTAARTGEVIGATWSEMDLRARVWTIPADRMKAGKAHRVPLSDRSMGILQQLHEARVDESVFPGQRSGGMSNMAMLTLLRRMGRHDLTVHGFRSSFRDWAAETTAHPRDVVEMALAHSLESKTEAAYRRGDLFEKRRELMDDWAGYCDRAEPAFGNVRQLFETT